MKIQIWTYITLVLLSISSCRTKAVEGNGNLITKEIPIEEYSSITFHALLSGDNWNSDNNSNKDVNRADILSCHYSQQKRATLSISIDKDMYKYLSIKSKNGKLDIRLAPDGPFSLTCLKITTGSKKLEKVTLSSGMKFYLDTPLSGNSLKLITSGGSGIYMKKNVRMESCQCNTSGGSKVRFENLTCNDFSCESSGGSELYLQGKAQEAEINASGGAKVNTYSFDVKDLKCNASGGSDVYVYATQQLDINTSGASKVHYKGAAKASTSSSGMSYINKEN